MAAKIKIFEPILCKFETEDMKRYCEDMIENIPDYIFTIPSSTSLKYHNKTQCGSHGQILHILMFGEIMNYILGLEYATEKIPDAKKRDCLRCTSIFHDAIKCGLNGSQYTVHNHPILAGEWVRNTSVEHDIDKDTKEYIAGLCESHSGQWCSSNRSKVVLPKPENNEQFLVHLCDYLASRNNLDMTYPDKVYETFKEFEPKLEDYVFDFGKYNGEKLIDVAKIDPGYIAWAKANMHKEPVKTLLTQL